jgi:hypothetical protein
MQSIAVRGFIAHNRETGAQHAQRPRDAVGNPRGCWTEIIPPTSGVTRRPLVGAEFEQNRA